MTPEPYSREGSSDTPMPTPPQCSFRGMTVRPDNRILCSIGRASAVLDNEKGIIPHDRMTRNNGPACRVLCSLQGRQERKQGLCCGHRLLYGRYPTSIWKTPCPLLEDHRVLVQTRARGRPHTRRDDLASEAASSPIGATHNTRRPHRLRAQCLRSGMTSLAHNSILLL